MKVIECFWMFKGICGSSGGLHTYVDQMLKALRWLDWLGLLARFNSD